MEKSGNAETSGATATGGATPGCSDEVIELNIPLEDGVFGCTLCTMEYGRDHDISDHAREQHSTTVLYTCSKCQRKGDCYRSATIHHGKCNGPRPSEAEAPRPFPCTVCGRAFVSKRSMTQHKRHRHLAIRNEERLANLNGPRGLPGNRVWSLEEEKNLVEYGQRLGLSARTKRALLAAIPGKTWRQILNKRKSMRRLGQWTQRANPEPDQMEIAEDRPRVSEPEAASRECGHGVTQEFEVNWRYVEKLTHQVVERIKQVGPRASDRKVRPKANRRQGSRMRPKNERRKRRFAEVQILWDRAPDKLAEKILDGESAQALPDLKTADKHFRALFETRNDLCGQLKYAGKDKCDPCVEIAPSEVKRVIKRCRLRGACGPDGLRPLSLKRSLPRGVEHELAKVFNLWLKFGKVPHDQCEHRTVLIPKAGAKPKEMSTWRPITVGNVLLRVFCSVIAKRLSSGMPINEIQRGFMPCDGISENCFFVRPFAQRWKYIDSGDGNCPP